MREGGLITLSIRYYACTNGAILCKQQEVSNVLVSVARTAIQDQPALRTIRMEHCYTIKLKWMTRINTSNGVKLMIMLALTPQSIY